MSYFSLQQKYISVTKSYGIIPFTIFNDEIFFLMIRRKNTYGYIDIIKGKYDIDNSILLNYLVNIMTITERNDILKYDFKTLWQKMWLHPNGYSNELEKKFDNNKKKYETTYKNRKHHGVNLNGNFLKGVKILKKLRLIVQKENLQRKQV